MKICKANDYKDMSRKAANIISAQVTLKPNCVLGLATGSTPIGVYKQLAKRHAKGKLDFSSVTTVNLDEYKGLAPDHPQSYRYFMNDNLFNKVNIDLSRTYVPDGLEEDSAAACRKYNEVLRAVGRVDLQLLGIGHNGHIGFNEPGEVIVPETNCVTLSEQTVKANTRFFESEAEVPKQAYTMGIKSILSARRILVIVSGEDKADIVKTAFFGAITPHVPASLLQLHDNVTLVADEAALSKCEL